MNIKKDANFVKLAENKMAEELLRFSNGTLNDEESKAMAKEVVQMIDWNNPALMHKGISWIAKNYINQLANV